MQKILIKNIITIIPTNKSHLTYKIKNQIINTFLKSYKKYLKHIKTYKYTPY